MCQEGCKTDPCEFAKALMHLVMAEGATLRAHNAVLNRLASDDPAVIEANKMLTLADKWRQPELQQREGAH